MGRAPHRTSCGERAPDRRRVGVRAGAAALVLAAALGGATAGSGAPATVTLTVVVHGQGRVVTEPASRLDCPGACSLVVGADATVTLRAIPASGHEVTQRFGCVPPRLDDPTCAVELRGFDQRVDVYFAPAGVLQLWPAGHGDLSVEPTGAGDDGEPLDPVCREDGIPATTGCLLRYVPGTKVAVTARPKAASTFVGWSGFRCPGTGACTVEVPEGGASLVARFSPLPLNVILGGDGTGGVVSDPPGVLCPPTCTGVHFPPGTLVTLVARPDAASPFLSWKFGCTVSPSDPRRCSVRVVSNPQWVGVALGADDEIGVPSTVSVLFDVARDGRGDVRGERIDCGERCSARFSFGQEETLEAVPAAGWRFTRWQGACEPRRRCTLLVGPVTSLGVAFTENLAPRLLSAGVRRRGGRREVVVRVGVAHAARAVVRLRRLGAAAGLQARAFAVTGGVTTLVRPLARSVRPGRYRVSVALSDGLGGGRTFTVTRRVGAP